MMGVAAQALGDKPSAITWLTKSAGLKETADIDWRLGSMYYDLNKQQQAQAAWRRGIELAKADEKATGKAPVWLDDTMYLYGDTLDEASKCAVWSEFVGRHPSDVQHLTVARTYTVTRCGK